MSQSSINIVPSVCPLDCPDTCSLEVRTREGKLLSLTGSTNNPVTGGYICGKVRQLPEHLYGPDRLKQPGIRTGRKGEGQFRAASWDEALTLVTKKLDEARQSSGGESILPFFYGGSNGFLTQGIVDERLFRRLGASQLARTVCAAPSSAASKGLYGAIPGVAMEDYANARLIVVWGGNPSATGIHLLPYIKQARKQGAKLIVVDPRATPLARQADLHIALRPGTDLPVALSLINELSELGAADERFLATHTTGAQELRRRASLWPIEKAAREAGVPPDLLKEFVSLYAETNPAVIRCGWGPERNRNGGSAIAAILALPAVAGKFGLRGGGFTLSNSGAWSFDLEAAIAAEKPTTRVINMNRLGEELLFERDPCIDVLFVYNANPVSTVPQQNRVVEGLSREGLFTIVFDSVLTDTARYADVVLPATTFLEHHELRRSYGVLLMQSSSPAVERYGESRPNYEVFAELCERLELDRPGDLTTVEELQQAVTRSHAESDSLADVIAHKKASPPPCGPRPIQFVDVFPTTHDKKIHLVPDSLEAESEQGVYVYLPLVAEAEFPLTLISPATSRSINSTLTQLDDRPAIVDLNPDDAAQRQIEAGMLVRIWNRLGEVHCRAAIDARLRQGVASLPKGLWSRHTENGQTANALVPDTLSDLGQGACFNDTRVQIAPLPEEIRTS